MVEVSLCIDGLSCDEAFEVLASIKAFSGCSEKPSESAEPDAADESDSVAESDESDSEPDAAAEPEGVAE